MTRNRRGKEKKRRKVEVDKKMKKRRNKMTRNRRGKRKKEEEGRKVEVDRRK